MVPIAIRDSGVKGLGVFADSHIPQGTHIFTLTGERTDYDTVCQLVDSGRLRNDDPLHIGEGVFLILDSLSNLFNHSCDPNLGVRRQGELFALRDIQPDEELCFDYSATVPARLDLGGLEHGMPLRQRDVPRDSRRRADASCGAAGVLSAGRSADGYCDFRSPNSTKPKS